MSLKRAMLYLFPYLFAGYKENINELHIKNVSNDYGDMRPASYGSPEFYSNVRKFKGYMRENRRFNSFNKKKR
jgi:hypothetical protein